MELSVAGLIVCLGVLALGYFARSILIVGLLGSLAFGATALATLTFLGSSSPLIYTFFAAMLVGAVAARRRIWRDLGTVFGSVGPMWLLCCLMLYAAVGAWLLPRLFAGQTSVFVQSKTRQGVIESALEPVSANISQTAYFILGGLTAIALCVLLLQPKALVQVRRGFFLWCSLHAGMGLLDVVGKLTGAGDILLPIRTASYAMLTNASEGSFSRIAGAYSEASAFGTVSLACLAFTYTYWRKTGSSYAKWLSAVLLTLLILSTSTTAYVGLTILFVPVAISLFVSLMSARLARDEMLIVVVLVGLVFVGMAVSLYDRGFFDPFVDLLQSTVVNKADTASGQERAYWNLKSLQAFTDTGGMGVGFGSSRASSWLIALLSQLGLAGTAMMAMLVAVVARGLGGLSTWVDAETDAIVSSVRACSLAGIIAASLVSGSADPGMVFFISLAVVSVARVHARHNKASVQGHRDSIYSTVPA